VADLSFPPFDPTNSVRRLGARRLRALYPGLLAGGCPILESGGSLEVYETIAV
jgi:hypothetical protein